ncbi:MAG: ankyrin repeat domain-containing protein [Planctomycetaceae bacterium]|nr:ankyrin repeat domain-containing protein [Planctomycetaceae bacterium]
MSTFENIFFAAMRGTIEDVRYFVEEKGANVNGKNDQGFTPLHLAGYNMADGAEIAQFLISKQANVDAEDQRGGHPLHVAANKGNVAVAKVLVHAGADVHATMEGIVTPIDLANRKGHIGHMMTVQYLSSMGAIPKF